MALSIAAEQDVPVADATPPPFVWRSYCIFCVAKSLPAIGGRIDYCLTFGRGI